LLRYDRILGEARYPENVMNILPIAMEPCCPIEHTTSSPDRITEVAEGRTTVETVETLPAESAEHKENRIAGSEPRHSWPNCFDDASSLMPRHRWKNGFQITLNVVQVTVADSRRYHANQDFAFFGWINVHLPDL
jgi:hypothetical protein